MRLWHKDLIRYLPDKQLLGQHRECCALRGKGWGKKHSTVDYVFYYEKGKLFYYHSKIMEEMKKRGFKVDPKWTDISYQGKSLPSNSNLKNICEDYSEHDDIYLEECLENLKNKGISIRHYTYELKD